MGENNYGNSQINDNEISLMRFERTHMEIIYELNAKRQLVTKYEQDLHNSILNQREIERQLSTGRKMFEQKTQEVETLKQNLAFLEKECYAATEKAGRDAVHLEIAEKEIQSLKAQNYNLCSENTVKTNKIEELEMRVNCLLRCEKEINNYVSFLRQASANIDRNSEQLKSDHDRIKQLVEEKDDLLSKLQINAEMEHSKYLQMRTQVDQLLKDCSFLRVELEKERSKNSSATTKTSNYEKLISDMNLISALRQDLQTERAISTSLSTIIDNLTQELLAMQQYRNNIESRHSVAIQTDDTYYKI